MRVVVVLSSIFGGGGFGRWRCWVWVEMGGEVVGCEGDGRGGRGDWFFGREDDCEGGIVV